jgi:hypothetical protein
MTIALVLILFSVAALVFLFYLARGRASLVTGVDDLRGYTRPVDIESFQNLIDPAEEEFLRANLTPANFRMVQRERLRATLGYVQCASHNASVLLRVGEAARASSDPKVVLAAEQLVQRAIRLRLYALMTIPKLYVAIAMPSARLSPARLVERYQQLSGLAGQLALIQNPARIPRLSAVL